MNMETPGTCTKCGGHARVFRTLGGQQWALCSTCSRQPDVEPPSAPDTSKADNGFGSAPKRYMLAGREVVDDLRDRHGDTAFRTFCLLTAEVYEARNGAKGDPVGDAEKARWFHTMTKHVDGDGPDPRAERPDFVPYQRPAGVIPAGTPRSPRMEWFDRHRTWWSVKLQRQVQVSSPFIRWVMVGDTTYTLEDLGDVVPLAAHAVFPTALPWNVVEPPARLDAVVDATETEAQREAAADAREATELMQDLDEAHRLDLDEWAF